MNCSWQTWQLFEHKVDLCAARFSLVLFSYILHPSEKKMKKNLVCRALTFGACFSLALVFSVTQVNAQSGSRLAAPLAGSGTSQVIPQAIGRRPRLSRTLVQHRLQVVAEAQHQRRPTTRLQRRLLFTRRLFTRLLFTQPPCIQLRSFHGLGGVVAVAVAGSHLQCLEAK